MVMAVVDGGSSSFSSSSYEVVICLEVVKTLFVVEILLFFFLGVTRLTVVTSGSMVVLSGDVFGCFRFCGRFCVSLTETVMQLVVLVAAGVVVHGCVRLVQVVVPVV